MALAYVHHLKRHLILQIMKRFSETLIISALVIFSVMSFARASQKVIRVGVYQNKPKVFIDKKGVPRGFFIDILEHIARDENWKLIYVPGTWEQCLIRLQNQQIDLLLDVADSVTRIGLFDFSKESLFSNWAVIYVPKDSTVDSILDLREKTIAAMRGDVSYEEFKEKLKRLDIDCRFREVDSFASVFRAIDQGIVDAGLISRLFGLVNESQHHVRRTGIICCPKNLYFAVPKNKNRWLIRTIDQHIRQLKKDEQSVYYTSFMEWIEGIQPRRLPHWLVLTLVLTATMLALFVVGFIVLEIKVNAKTNELKKSNQELEAARQRLLSQMKSLETINDIANRLYRSLDYKSVVQQAVDSMANYSQSPLVAFFEYREGDDRMYLLASSGFENGLHHVCESLPIHGNLTGEAITAKKIIICNDIENDPRIEAKAYRSLVTMGLKSILAVPLMYGDDVFGVMNLLFKDKVQWEADQIETLLSIGKTIALALANARHVEQMKQEIANRTQAEKEKEKLQRQLMHAQKMEAVGTLASGIAHDFNNILQGIYGYVQVMMFNRKEGDPDLKFLKQIEEIALKASGVVRQLLTFSREIKSELKPTDLNQVIKHSLRLIERSLSKMIEIRLLLDPNLKLIRADNVQLEQVLLNLCINAGYAMGENGRLTIQTENIHLSKTQGDRVGLDSGSYVVLSITDTGHGMEKDVVERIFDPFFTTKKSGEGTGLGLSMVYGIVKQHGGHIICNSRPQYGTRFDIYFPAIDMDAVVASDAETQIRVQGSETILMVDDELPILDVSKHLLTQHGYTVITADTPEKAIRYYTRHKKTIDLVIMDIYMPKTSGFTCLERLLEIDPEIKVIMSSGQVTRKIRDDVLKAGGKGFIAKPYRIEALLATIRAVLTAG